MIETAKVRERVNQLTKSGTSGYQTAPEFNGGMSSTLLNIISQLCADYELDNRISDYMNKTGLAVPLTTTTQANGFLAFPENHFRTLSILKKDTIGGADEYPFKKINANERGMYSTSPIRAFSAEKKRFGYYFTTEGLMTLPAGLNPVVLTYCKRPVDPVLVLEFDDNDYEVVDPSTTNIDLPENLFNLFCYKMLENASVEMKERALTEYAMLGIQKEL